MSGLLDMFNTGDPQKDSAISRGLLQAGLQLMQSKGRFLPNLGAGGMAGIGGFDQERQRQLHAKRIGLQDELLTSQVDQQKREAELAKLPGQFYRAPSVPGTDATGGMETAQENPNNASGPGGFDMPGYIQALMGKDPVRALQLQASLQKEDPLVKGQPGDVFFDKTGNQRFSVPAKPEKEAEETQIAKLIRERNKLDQADPTRRIFDEAIRKASTHQPATKVEVNTGQKGFDNTLKLRSDFRSEPVYKAHQEMQSAYAQIQQSLKQQSPAGDLAGATKVMKLLDPGSVVRESELGMAMAATGLLDKVTNYAQMVISGNKLNPAQRKDFQKLADSLYSESVKQYNSKRGEYKGIVERNALNEADVVGPEARTVKRSGTLNGRKVVEYSDGSVEYQD